MINRVPQLSEAHVLAKARTQTKFETIAETAVFFQVSERTVSRWLTDPTFPGRAGSAFIGDGRFPIKQIAGWLEQRAKRKAGDPDAQLTAAIARERLRKLNLENDETEGKLLDAEIVLRLMTRTAAMAKQMLYQLQFEVPALLPPSVPVEERNAIAERVKGSLDQRSTELAKALRELQPD